MADSKITGLTALTLEDLAPTDMLPVVDVSDTTMAGTGTTKRLPAAGILAPAINAQTADYPLVLADAHDIVTVDAATAKTVTIPLDSSVAFRIGTQIRVVRLGAGNVVIAATGGVTLNSPTSVFNCVRYGVVTLTKIGTDSWVVNGALEQPFLFWLHDDSQTIPNNVWTPLALNSMSQTSGNWTTFAAASTTIAAGSNGAALPQATINVASAASFASSGYILVNIGGTDRLVRYTGKSATTFTGCTLATGTMTTGDAVRQGNVTFSTPYDSLINAIFEVAWASNATGARGIRMNFGGGFVGGAAFETDVATHATQRQRSLAGEQPANVAGTPFYLEVFQDSGGDLDSLPVSLGAPRLVAYIATGYHV